MKVLNILKKIKNNGTSFRLVLSKGVGKMFLKKLMIKKQLKSLRLFKICQIK